MKEVNKGELAKYIGKSGGVISRFINDGILNNCFTPSGKINLEKAIRAIIFAKGSDYIQNKVEPADDKKYFYLTVKQRELFKIDFVPDMFDLEKADAADVKDLIDGLPEINSSNMMLRDFADDCSIDIFEYALEYAMDIKDVESFYNVVAK